MQCTAKSKQSGERCKKSAVVGFTVCEIHGGKTPVGIASPNYKTGEHVRHKLLPTPLKQLYEEVSTDPELLSVRKDLHLLDALIAAKLDKLEDNEGAATWKRVGELIRAVRKAYKKEDYGGLEDALDEMEGIADKKRLFYATEQELKSDLALRSRLIDTENKTLFNKERALTAEQAMLLVSALLDSVKRNVLDTTALSAIQADFIRLIGATNQQRVIEAGNTD